MAVMMAACTIGDDYDSSYYAEDSKIYHVMAEYEADWVMDNQVIGHAKLTYNSSKDVQSQLEISNFPYLLTVIAFPEINGVPEFTSETSTGIKTNDYAYSSSSVYYSLMAENISYDVELAGVPYTITLKTGYNGNVVFYDINKDTFSILLTIHGMSRADKQGTVLWEQRFEPAVNLLLLTTKHIN